MQNGTDRSSGSTFPPALHFNEKFEGGGIGGKSTYNVPFEIIRPNINSITPNGTAIDASIRTVSGTSISGSEISFVDKGFEPITLGRDNYMDSPRLGCLKN